MALPVVTAHTRRLYDDLPELYRLADVDDGVTGPGSQGAPLLRFLSLIGDREAVAEELLDRFAPDAGPSALVDPATADPAWLPWLAQLVGVELDTAAPLPSQRVAISGAAGGWRAGLRSALVAAARQAGTTSAKATPHAGGDWRVIGLRVRVIAGLDDTTGTGTPAQQTEKLVRDLITRQQLKPAGFALAITVVPTITWDELDTLRVTFARAETMTVRQLGALVA